MKRKSFSTPEAALEALGNTAEEVAKSLARRRIKSGAGYKRSECCPLTRFLRRMGWKNATVLGTCFLLNNDDGYHVGKGALPLGARQFVYAFDAGRFPKLIGADSTLWNRQ